jgi:hypothetical protein
MQQQAQSLQPLLGCSQGAKQTLPQSVIDFVHATQTHLLAREKMAFQIVEKVSPVSYQVKLPNRRKPFRQFYRNMIKRWVAPADIFTIVMTGEEETEVDQLPLDLPDIETAPQPPLNTGRQLTDKQQEELECLLEEFKEVFRDQPGLTRKVEHHIRTGATALVAQHLGLSYSSGMTASSERGGEGDVIFRND